MIDRKVSIDVRIYVNFNEESNEEDSICNEDCPIDLEHRIVHEAAFSMYQEACEEAIAVYECRTEVCHDVHQVIAAACLAAIGLHDKENHDALDLPWFSGDDKWNSL